MEPNFLQDLFDFLGQKNRRFSTGSNQGFDLQGQLSDILSFLNYREPIEEEEDDEEELSSSSTSTASSMPSQATYDSQPSGSTPSPSGSTTSSMPTQATYDSGSPFQFTDQFPDSGGALDAQISAQEAASICGPLVLYDFQRRYGRNPSMGEALSLKGMLDLSKQNGWTVAGGMNGMQNLEKTAKAAGLNLNFDYTPSEQELISYLTAGDNRMAGLSGNKHYYGVSAYDPNKGFYLGDTGEAMRKYGGKEWMTWAELMGMDAIDGSMYYNY